LNDVSFSSQTSRPRFDVPPGACDTHVHVFGDDPREVRNPNAPAEAPLRAPWAAIDAMHHALGIERAVLVQNTLVQPNYDVLLDDLAARPHFRAVALVNDDTPSDDLARLHAGGVRGIRFHFASFMQHGQGSLEVMQRSAERVAPLGWHVVLHIHAAQLLELAPIILSLPTPAVIDHMGHVHYDNGLDDPAFTGLLELQRNENIWIKIGNSDRWSNAGAPNYEDAIPFGRALVANGSKRLMWGSDWPHALYPAKRPPPDDADLLNLLAEFAPDSSTRNAILVDNPQRLYGFPA
jgi:2-pyrone-4,6-dicarboxylate lactonase